MRAPVPYRFPKGLAMRKILSSLTQTYLDLNFRTAGNLDVQIAEFPGRWMSESELALIRQDLRVIASKSLGGMDLDYGVFDDKSERLNHSIVTIIKNQDKTPVAFNALAVIKTDINHRDTQVLHLGLVMIDPEKRQRGFSWILYGLTCFLLFLRNGLRPIHVSNVTQVPAVAGLVGETFSHVYPTPVATENADFGKLLLARSIMQDHRHVFGVGDEAEFDEQKFIICNAYTGGSDQLKKTFEKTSKHRNENYNIFCQTVLDYDRGDDLLQLGQIDLAAASKYIRREVPKGSILNIAVLSLLMMARRVVLPALHWFNSSKDFGTLRSIKK